MSWARLLIARMPHLEYNRIAASHPCTRRMLKSRIVGDNRPHHKPSETGHACPNLRYGGLSTSNLFWHPRSDVARLGTSASLDIKRATYAGVDVSATQGRGLDLLRYDERDFQQIWAWRRERCGDKPLVTARVWHMFRVQHHRLSPVVNGGITHRNVDIVRRNAGPGAPAQCVTPIWIESH